MSLAYNIRASGNNLRARLEHLCTKIRASGWLQALTQLFYYLKHLLDDAGVYILLFLSF